MNTSEIFSHVDHTYLAALSTWDKIEKLCNEAIAYGAASVCIPPCYVARVRETFPDLNICTVIGFPLGYQTTETKAFEAADAVKNGANEVDMVINLCSLKNGDYEAVKQDIAAVRKATEGRILKVIVETCYLNEDEKIRLCGIVTETGADYIKTSTGFGTSGAKSEDVELFKEHLGENVKIKASGGIHFKNEMIGFLSLGCERLGMSRAIAALALKPPEQ